MVKTRLLSMFGDFLLYKKKKIIKTAVLHCLCRFEVCNKVKTSLYTAL